MPRKQKHRLPSGSVRLQAYDYTDENGKKHYKSFTAPTLAEAKAMRSEWQLERKRGQKKKDNCDLTVQEAVRRYIDAKDGALSPGTIRGYESLYNVRFCGQFGKLHLDELDDEGVQIWISDLSRHLSPKTVSNTYVLFFSAIKMFQKHAVFEVLLPAEECPELYCPSDSDVKTFINLIAEDPELERAVLLAAFGPLRRGEICALTDKDIRGNIVIINSLACDRKNFRNSRMFDHFESGCNFSPFQTGTKALRSSRFSLSRFPSLFCLHHARHRCSGSIYYPARRLAD